MPDKSRTGGLVWPIRGFLIIADLSRLVADLRHRGFTTRRQPTWKIKPGLNPQPRLLHGSC